MRCPKCNATIPINSRFCQICGNKTDGIPPMQEYPRYDPFSVLGDLGKEVDNMGQKTTVVPPTLFLYGLWTTYTGRLSIL